MTRASGRLRASLLFSLSVASAVLTLLAFPSFDLGFLAWFTLAPLLFALRQARPLPAAALGFLWAFLFGSGVFYWLMNIPGVTPLPFVLMMVAGSLYYLAFGGLYCLTTRALPSWAIVGAPALWVALEYARANLFFLALPWNLLGHSQHSYLPLIQIADATGVYGISFLLVMSNQFLSQLPNLLSGRKPRIWAPPILALALAVGLTLSYGWYALIRADAPERRRVAIVQANVLVRDNMALADQVQHLRSYERLTREVAGSKPDLIVWPSSSLPAPIDYSRLVQFTVARLARETRTHLLVGGAGGQKFGPRRKGTLPYSNSQFLISPLGRVEAQYHKIRLTPFDEYVPLQGYITWPKWISSLRDSYIPGDRYTIFQVSGARFAAPICWESLFPDLFRRFVTDGAQFMVSVTNEGFFGPTAAPRQTLVLNVFRAVENRVAIARAATTGVSAFISPNGEVVERVRDGSGNDLFVAGFLVRELPLSNTRTFYTLHGDIFAFVTIGFAIVLVLVSLMKPARRRSYL